MVNLFNKLKHVISSLIVIVVVFGLIFYFTPTDVSKSRLVYDENLSFEIPADAVHSGDLVVIDYVLYFADDGRVVDTNNAELAKKSGLKTFASGPVRLIVGKSGKVKGFDKALVGMKVGENKEFFIPASEPATKYLLNKTREYSRNQNIPIRQVFPVKSFKKLFGSKTYKVNDIVSSKKFPWKYQIINVSSDAVGVIALIKEKQEFQLPGLEWKSVILRVSDYDAFIRHNPKEGQLVNTNMGPARINTTVGKIMMTYDLKKDQEFLYSRDVGGVSNPHLFKVLESTDKVLIERIDNLAEKKLKLNVTLIDRTAEIISLDKLK